MCFGAVAPPAFPLTYERSLYFLPRLSDGMGFLWDLHEADALGRATEVEITYCLEEFPPSVCLC